MIRLEARPLTQIQEITLSDRVQRFFKQYGRVPKLAVVLVGENPASVIYTRKKGETAVRLGMDHESVQLPANTSPERIAEALQVLNDRKDVDGILLQRPLPEKCREEDVIYWISPEKDVDAFHPENVGRLQLGVSCLKPCTPMGVIKLLEYYSLSIEGKVACVIGRSSIVGKPMAALLLQRHATVLQCHSKTRNLSHWTKQADILVVAAGQPQLIDASHVAPQTIVIDVGIHRLSNGKIVGDVDFDAVSKVASALSPVPGGVGPMTILQLMENTLQAAEERQKK